jgi:ABC-type transport system involved in multi-copper enzyme maturation permease subunit
MTFAAKSYTLVLVIAVICVIMEAFVSYSYGYYGSPESYVFFLVLIRSGWMLLFIVLIVALIRATFQRKKRLLTLVSMLALITLNLVSNKLVRPNALILRGMQKRILQDHDLSELRKFAREFDRLPHIATSDVTASSKTYTKGNLTESGLVAKYPFLSSLGAPTAIEDGNVVCVVAGRPRKGVFITIDGRPIDSEKFSNDEVFRPSIDIIFAVIGD